MNALFLLRHAKAVAQHTDGDRARGLTDVGRDSARAIAAAMADRHLAPNLILCSDSARTRETLAIVLPNFRPPPSVVYEESLYLADAKQLLQRLRRVPEGTGAVMLVGHNPGLQELATMLSDQTAGPLMARLMRGFPAAALARFDVNLSWLALDRGGARLTAFLVPAVPAIKH